MISMVFPWFPLFYMNPMVFYDFHFLFDFILHDVHVFCMMFQYVSMFFIFVLWFQLFLFRHFMFSLFSMFFPWFPLCFYDFLFSMNYLFFAFDNSSMNSIVFLGFRFFLGLHFCWIRYFLWFQLCVYDFICSMISIAFLGFPFFRSMSSLIFGDVLF